MKEDNKKGNVKSYIYYIIILVVVLIISTVSVAYAYVSLLNNEEKEANASITGKTDCINIQLEPAGSVPGLTYNYPITDDFATTGDKVKPVTITLKNICTEAGKSVDYTVALSTLSSTATASTTIPDSSIKIKAVKNTGTDTTIINSQILSGNGVKKITNAKTTYNLLNDKLNADNNAKAYTIRNHYVIESGKLASNSSVTYKVYLWIDYDEGNEDNNATQGKNFASVLSAVINNPETFTE